MPKKPFFESAIHHLLLQARKLAEQERVVDPKQYKVWEQFVNSFVFSYIDHETIRVDFTLPKKGTHTFTIARVKYYTRGDTQSSRQAQEHEHLPFNEDMIQQHNDQEFAAIILSIAKKAGISVHKQAKHVTHGETNKIDNEEALSDKWALSVDPASIDPIATNTAITSPELRYIHTLLADVRGKRILDLGSGLGEVSIYFAMRGARVTSVDLSRPMLLVTEQLAKRYNVPIKTKQASVEQLHFSPKEQFDIVYVGNLFHHVDIKKTLDGILRYLHPDGILVCWEPVHYNPIINVYRKIATRVRSHDERPFTLSDIALFGNYFGSVRVQWHWLTTLLIFIIMALVEGRNPNSERYWKAIISEEKKWKPLYVPLSVLDRILLFVFPVLGPLCWNVVLVCTHPKKNRHIDPNRSKRV